MTQGRTTRMTTTSRNVLKNESAQDPKSMNNTDVTTTAAPVFSSSTTKFHEQNHQHDYETQLRNRIQGFLVPTFDWLNDGVLPTNTTRDKDEQSGHNNHTHNRNNEGTLLEQAYAILTSSSDQIQAPNPGSVVVAPQQQQQISAEDEEVEPDDDDVDEVDYSEDEITIEPIKFDNYVHKQQTRNYHQHCHDEEYVDAKNGRPRSRPRRRRRSHRRRARTLTTNATDDNAAAANRFHNPYTVGSVDYYRRKELLLDDASGLLEDLQLYKDVITEFENMKMATTNEAKAA